MNRRLNNFSTSITLNMGKTNKTTLTFITTNNFIINSYSGGKLITTLFTRFKHIIIIQIKVHVNLFYFFVFKKKYQIKVHVIFYIL